MITKKTQLPMASQKSEPSLQNASVENLRQAEFLTRKMFSAYPDYNKASPEYLLTITELVASYPTPVQLKICDIRFGVPSKTSYLPTAKDIVDFATPLLANHKTMPPPAQVDWDKIDDERLELQRIFFDRGEKRSAGEILKSAWRSQRGLN